MTLKKNQSGCTNTGQSNHQAKENQNTKKKKDISYYKKGLVIKKT